MFRDVMSCTLTRCVHRAASQDIVTLDDAVARVCDIAARTLRYSKARARLASVSDVAIALAAGADAGDVAAAVTSALSGCDGAAVFVARALLSAAAGGSCPSDAAMEHLDASVDALQQRVGAVSVAAKTWSSLRTVVDVMETLLPQAPRDNVIVRSMEAAVAAAVAMETPMVARMASAIAARATEPEDGGERQRFAAAVHSAVVSVCVAAAAVPLLAAEHDIAQRRTRVATTLTRLGLKQQLDTEAFETALVTVIMVAPPSPSSARTAAMSSARAVAAEVAAADTTAIASDKSRVLAAVPAGGLGPSVQAVVAEWSSVIAEEAARTTDVERWHDTAARLTTVVGKLKQAPQWLWANAMQRVVEVRLSLSHPLNITVPLCIKLALFLSLSLPPRIPLCPSVMSSSVSTFPSLALPHPSPPPSLSHAFSLSLSLSPSLSLSLSVLVALGECCRLLTGAVTVSCTGRCQHVKQGQRVHYERQHCSEGGAV
jgi:hypothetical protein